MFAIDAKYKTNIFITSIYYILITSTCTCVSSGRVRNSVSNGSLMPKRVMDFMLVFLLMKLLGLHWSIAFHVVMTFEWFNMSIQPTHTRIKLLMAELNKNNIYLKCHCKS